MTSPAPCREAEVRLSWLQVTGCGREGGVGGGSVWEPHQHVLLLPPGPSAYSVVAGSRPRLGPSVPSPCSGEMLTGDPALKFAASGDSWLSSASRLIQMWASGLESATPASMLSP